MKRFLTTMVVLTILFASCKKDKPKTAPTVTTSALTNIASTSATAGGTITSDGNSPITASGIVLSRAHATPTLMDTVITSTATSGSFTSNITNLEFGRTYYIRAYATNAIGTSYGDVVTLNTSNDTSKVRFTYNGQEVTYGIIISSATGKKWMDRNLGASQVATSATDANAYGDLFQWGRLADGHQFKNSDTIRVQSSTDVPGHNKFIRADGMPKNDWRNPQNGNLWQLSTGINNPCPTGWHVPTATEWQAETPITNATTAFTHLKMPTGGYRYFDGSVSGAGASAYYWSSTTFYFAPISQYFGKYLGYDGSSASIGNIALGNGMSIRCIKD